ncbi:ceramide glucosyltransferase [Novosphingobium sp. PhB165]|uniref:bacteriohopanetetrol glucosamine biosynthesis glycosyltransferase HpnI n=1 Tax=Novosphingobium sp. PhB165 TaxID=2485105 RepID=UPI001044E7DC|nr:bacteriohopanetetrol glucosamine biosynthesis glycosyltransferase HpnI [Novosphingobium sp. PhB165]TCM16053.1 ceramide glucosyltransferase [Novosphingobium sp. PhB165]
MTVLTIMMSAVGWILLLMAGIGAAYLAAATFALDRFLRAAETPVPGSEAVTILKPLYGREPRLLENLASFVEQDHDGRIQILCGVQRPDDPAIETVRALQARFPEARIDLVVDGTRHGPNGKISNLVNMMGHAAHDTLVLSDSDMAVERDYLSRLLPALRHPETGAVTCLYRGRGDGGFWSRLAAAGSSYQFLPNLVFAKTRGMAAPCMGSTIALRRETLDAIGGFARFADVLADDHAMGQAIARLGLSVDVPPMVLTHAFTDARFREVWRHELRWAATVRGIAPAGYAGSFITVPFPLALMALPFHPVPGLVAVVGTALVRLCTKRVVDRHTDASSAPFWSLPLRDILSFAIFLASFFVRSVDWRGTALNMVGQGRVTVSSEIART